MTKPPRCVSDARRVAPIRDRCLCSVKSRGFFEQMKGRSVRVISATNIRQGYPKSAAARSESVFGSHQFRRHSDVKILLESR